MLPGSLEYLVVFLAADACVWGFRRRLGWQIPLFGASTVVAWLVLARPHAVVEHYYEPALTFGLVGYAIGLPAINIISWRRLPWRRWPLLAILAMDIVFCAVWVYVWTWMQFFVLGWIWI